MKNSRRNDVDDDDGSIFCRLLQPLIRRSVLIVCTPYWRNTNTTMSDCGADDDGSGAQSKDRRQMEKVVTRHGGNARTGAPTGLDSNRGVCGCLGRRLEVGHEEYNYRLVWAEPPPAVSSGDNSFSFTFWFFGKSMILYVVLIPT